MIQLFIAGWISSLIALIFVTPPAYLLKFWALFCGIGSIVAILRKYEFIVKKKKTDHGVKNGK